MYINWQGVREIKQRPRKLCKTKHVYNGQIAPIHIIGIYIPKIIFDLTNNYATS